VGVKYEEESILDMVQNFRWESLYNAKEHGEKVKAAEQDLITAEHLRNRLQQEWNELDKQIGSPDVTGATLKRFNDKFNAKDEELRKAKETVEYRSSKLAGLRQQKHGSEAVRIVQLRIKNFIETGRNDIEKRAEFNRWVHDEGLVLAVDPETKDFFIGTGYINKEGKLTAFIDVEELKQQVGNNEQKHDFGSEIETLGPEESWRQNFPDAPPLADIMSKGALVNIVDSDGKETGLQYKIESPHRGRPAKRRRQSKTPHC
jgi:hypothetical protein